MDDLTLWFAVFSAMVICLLAAAVLGRFVFGTAVGKRPGWHWWQRLVAGVACLVVPLAMPAVYQHSRGVKATWKSWSVRGFAAALLMVAAVLVGDSEWLKSNELSRDSFAGLVYLLSSTAVSLENATIISESGMPFEVTGRWSTALFFGAYGASFGLMYLRHTFSAIIGFAWLGLVVGAFLSASYYAWMIDLSALLDRVGYGMLANSHFYLPIHLAPWLAVGILSRVFASQERRARPDGEAIDNN